MNLCPITVENMRCIPQIETIHKVNNVVELSFPLFFKPAIHFSYLVFCECFCKTPRNTKYSLYPFLFHVLLMPRKNKPQNPLTFRANADPDAKYSAIHFSFFTFHNHFQIFYDKCIAGITITFYCIHVICSGSWLVYRDTLSSVSVTCLHILKKYFRKFQKILLKKFWVKFLIIFKKYFRKARKLF